jgi:hypothetical protein
MAKQSRDRRGFALHPLATGVGLAEPRRAHLPTSQGRRVRPRLTRNPIIETTAAFNVATRGTENNFLGCPHHRHDTLATVVGLPHAEQTFTCRMEVFFLGEPRT